MFGNLFLILLAGAVGTVLIVVFFLVMLSHETATNREKNQALENKVEKLDKAIKQALPVPIPE